MSATMSSRNDDLHRGPIAWNTTLLPTAHVRIKRLLSWMSAPLEVVEQIRWCCFLTVLATICPFDPCLLIIMVQAISGQSSSLNHRASNDGSIVSRRHQCSTCVSISNLPIACQQHTDFTAARISSTAARISSWSRCI
jgi:hypothetical protein